MADPKIFIRRSATPNKVPTVDQLALGELAINTYDGKLYLEQDQGSVGVGTTIVAVNPWSVGVGSTAYNIYFTAGSVGIGITIPTSKLHIAGDALVTGITTLASATATSVVVGSATTITAGGIDAGSGIVTARQLSQYRALIGAVSSATETFIVTVANKTTNHRYYGTGSSQGYFIDGKESPFITLIPGKTYRFDQADGSNGSHPLRFYLEANRTTQYTTNVTTNGTAGSAGAYTEITIIDTTPIVLHYQCSNHAGMGNAVSNAANFIDTPYQITARSGVSVTGVVTATSFSGDGANLTNTGATLSAGSGAQRVVLTSLTSGVMTTAATDAELSYNSTTDTLSATNIIVSGNISVGGTVTSMDITNVDSVGIITAQQGLQVLANGINITGVSTLSGGVNASQGIDAAGLRVSGIATLGQTNTTGFSNAGVSTLGDARAATLVVSGFSTFSGGASATLLNISGVTTISGGVNASQGIDAAGLRVTGIATHGQTTTTGLSNAGVSTLGNATATTLVVSGVSTLSGGVNASQGIDAAGLRVTGITTLGQTNVTGFSNAGVSTLGDARASTLVVTGFTTVGSISAGNVILAGITTGLNASGISTLTSVAGVSANFSGISTLASVEGVSANFSGISTLASITATNISVAGIATISGGVNASQGVDLARLRVTGITTLGQTNTTGLSNAGVSTLGNATASTLVVSGFSTFGATSTTLLNVSGVGTIETLIVTGNISVGGTVTSMDVTNVDSVGIITAQVGLQVLANGINITGVSTLSGGVNASQGADLARLRVTGITTLGQTNTTGFSNAGVSALGDAVASTLVVSGFSTLGATSATILNVSGISTLGSIGATNLSVSGVTTSNSYTINGTTIVNSSRQLQNIASLDATTTATIEAAIVNAPNTFTDLNVTGFSTLASVSAGNVAIAGIVTGLNASGISTLTSVAGVSANFSGISTLASITATNVNIAGVTTISGGLNASQGIDASGLRITGITTLGQTTTTGLSNAGVSTLGNATASTLVVSGVSTFSGGVNAPQGIDATGLRVTGITTLGQTNVTGFSNAGVSTLGDARASTLVVTGFSTFSGNVGIKTTIITEALTVAGIVSATSFYGTLNASQLTGILPVIDGSNLFGVTAAGSGIQVRDDGSVVGTAATIDFGSGLSASFGVGIATITALADIDWNVDPDFGLITDSAILSTDLGLIADSSTQSYNLGLIFAGGLVYPSQFILPSFTVSTLPSVNPAGQMLFVTDETGGSIPAFSDGTNWRRVTDRQIVS